MLKVNYSTIKVQHAQFRLLKLTFQCHVTILVSKYMVYLGACCLSLSKDNLAAVLSLGKIWRDIPIYQAMTLRGHC